MAQPKQKSGIALVGLGEYATGQLIPALKETKSCYLAGLVNGDEQKMKKWKEEMNVPDGNLWLSHDC